MKFRLTRYVGTKDETCLESSQEEGMLPQHTSSLLETVASGAIGPSSEIYGPPVIALSLRYLILAGIHENWICLHITGKPARIIPEDVS